MTLRTLNFLFSNQSTFRGSRRFINSVVEKLSEEALHNKKKSFLKEYTANFDELSDKKILACIAIAGADKYELVESLIRHFKRHDVRSFDKLSWTFLRDINLRYIQRHLPASHTKLLQFCAMI